MRKAEKNALLEALEEEAEVFAFYAARNPGGAESVERKMSQCALSVLREAITRTGMPKGDVTDAERRGMEKGKAKAAQ